jgi:sugar O-acyltransferase (sialic acid O-acetyltransferase NeuD family)
LTFVLYAVSSPYAAEALETARRLGLEVAGCVRNLPGSPVPEELPDPIEADQLGAQLIELPFLVALVTPRDRRLATADAYTRGFARMTSLVDPTAVVARSATLSPGAYVNAGAIVAAGTHAGQSCMINRGASIGHHCEIGDYVTIGPGAVTGGGCRFGDGVFLGVGSVVAPEVGVGAGALVGAGAVVVSDVPENVVVVGNPARVLRALDQHSGGDA